MLYLAYLLPEQISHFINDTIIRLLLLITKTLDSEQFAIAVATFKVTVNAAIQQMTCTSLSVLHIKIVCLFCVVTMIIPHL